MATTKSTIGAAYVVISLRRHPRAQTYVTHYLRSNLDQKTPNKLGKVHDIWGESVPMYQKGSGWAEYRLLDGFYLMKQPSATETYAKTEEDGTVSQLPKPVMRVIKVENGNLIESSESAVREAFKMPAKVSAAKTVKVQAEHTTGAVILNF